MSSPEREIRSLVETFAAAIAELMERELHAVFGGAPALRPGRALAPAEPPRTSPPQDAGKPGDLGDKVLRLLADNTGGTGRARRIGDAAIAEALQAPPAAVGRAMRALMDDGRVDRER